MSTIIIRLQNLPLSAKAADIREFFGDLKIPKGSVNIVGGPHGDAFIGFASDEDARVAMLLDGRLLHNAKIHLMLSSRREMDQVIAAAQAHAQSVKSGQIGAPQNQTGGQNGLTKTEPVTLKAEVISPPAITSSAASIQPCFGIGTTIHQQPPALPSPQVLQQLTFSQQQSQVPLGGDSWKNQPQQLNNNVFPPSQLNMGGGPQKIPVFPASIPPAQFQVPPPQVLQQHQYQQLPQQPPGFPPPIVQPSNVGQPPPQIVTGGFQQPPPNLPRPPFFGPPLQQTANVDSYFKQPPPQQQTTAGGPPRFPPPQFGGGPGQTLPHQQQFFGAPPTSHGPQQQHFGGGIPPGPSGGSFRPNQQQFGRRNANQPYGGQQAQQPPFRGQQRPAGNFRGPFGQSQPQMQHFGGQSQPQQQYGEKRRRSRSPNGGEAPNKRFNMAPKNVGGFGGQQGQQLGTAAPYQHQQLQKKQRICVQLSNVPYKATYEDIQDYLSTAKAKCIKCTRVYMPDRNFSDRWIVEFDNEDDARSVCKYHGEIAGRTIRFKIRAERIPPRRADEQYAVMEPEERETANGDRRSRRDEPRRDGRRDGSRERSRDRDRNQSRSPRNRDRSRDLEDWRALGQDKSKTSNQERSRRRSKSQDGRNNNRSRERQNHIKSPTTEGTAGGNINEEQSTQKEVMGNTAQAIAANQQPIPLSATFGAFTFPAAQANQAVYNSKSGTTVQLGGGIEGIRPMPLRSFDPQPSQFFPTIPAARPPPLFGGLVSATGANALPLGHRSAIGDGQTHAHSMTNGPSPVNNIHTSSVTSPTFAPPTFSLDSTAGSTALIIDTGSLDGEADDTSGNCAVNNEVVRQQTNKQNADGGPGPTSTSSSSSSAIRPSFPVLSSIPDQPPLDLLEPQGGNNNQKNQPPIFSSPPINFAANTGPTTVTATGPHISSSSSTNPTLDLRIPPMPPKLPMMPMRRSFDSIPMSVNRNHQQIATVNGGQQEFSQQEVELRPHLLFLDCYRQDPNSKSCIRLENVPKMVFVEQLSDFLGAKIDSPCHNIARMFNAVLYINLDNELLAAKAASRNGQLLDGSQIGITQLRKSEMADAIRQNMIIIREMYRLTVVARGFPLMVQPGEVLSLFERFNVNKDGVEKCAVKNVDTQSTFLLTFPTVQDCRNAIRELNGIQFVDGRLEVFQPEGLATF